MHVLLAIGCALFSALARAQESAPAAPARGLTLSTEHATPGYTLFTPLRSASTYLVDLAGSVVHEWKSDAPPGQWAYLLDNGHILRAERVDSAIFHGGGQGGRVREIDWDGKVVWEYLCADDTRLQHHDIEPLPNGHVLVIAWERKLKDDALAAGRDPKALAAGEIWPDMVLEIEPTPPSGGKVVWEWHAWDHLIQDLDEARAHFGDVAAHPERIDVNCDLRLGPSTDSDPAELERLRKIGYVGDGPPANGPGGGRDGGPGRGGDWTHCNSIDYHPGFDLILLSARETSEIWVIDHSTTMAEARTSAGGRYGKGGDLLFRWGNPRVVRKSGEPTLFHQHDAQWIAAGLPGAGHLLVFNNGSRESRESSSVDELAVDLSVDALKKGAVVEKVWSFSSPGFFSSHISGAQRLPSGNTLICDGEQGRVFEVTPAGEIAWDYLNHLKGALEPMGGPPRGGPPGGAPPRGRGGPPPGGGRGGPGDPYSLFRAWRYAPDHPGLARLAAKAEAEPAGQR